MDSIDILSNDLRRLHFHTVGAGYLAEKLYELGYRQPGRLLTAEEIGDNLDLEVEATYPRSDGSYTMTVSVDKLLKAQLDQRGE